MNKLFLKYYYDITKINILVTVLLGLQHFAIFFGTFGTAISFFVYRYFAGNQYYFYLNQGFRED